MEHIIDRDADFVFLSETWLKNDKNDVTANIDSYGYNLIHNRRKNRDKIQGGGVGIMFKKTLSTKQIRTKQYDSFELSVVNLKTSDNQAMFDYQAMFACFYIDFYSFLQKDF